MVEESVYICGALGGVAERLNASVLKTEVLATVPGVRIPPPPQSFRFYRAGLDIVETGPCVFAESRACSSASGKTQGAFGASRGPVKAEAL